MNSHKQSLINDLRSSETKLWKRIASDLSKSTRAQRVVNVSRLARYTKENETVIIPGKVLGSGELPHALTVAAWDFSKGARQQIEKAKGKCLSISELHKQNPQGQKVRILG
ncbi:MAG: 50S ribosomal protein L18e [Candidatus Nanoarchaeia archaeon]